jgi:hypothetical protein
MRDHSRFGLGIGEFLYFAHWLAAMGTRPAAQRAFAGW